MLSQPAPPPVARAIAGGGTKGALTAPAHLTGSLGIPVPGCQLSTGSPRTVVIDYRSQTVRIDGRRRLAERISTAVRFSPSGSWRRCHTAPTL